MVKSRAIGEEDENGYDDSNNDNVASECSRRLKAAAAKDNKKANKRPANMETKTEAKKRGNMEDKRSPRKKEKENKEKEAEKDAAMRVPTMEFVSASLNNEDNGNGG